MSEKRVTRQGRVDYPCSPLTIKQLKSLKIGDWVWVQGIVPNSDQFCILPGYYQIELFAVTHIHLKQGCATTVVPYSLYNKEWLAFLTKGDAEIRFTRKDSTYYEKAMRELQEYENKKESGLLIELPCRVGTWVYCITGSYKWVGLFRRDYFYDIVEYPFDLTMLDNYKLDWFLTKDEAEAKLKILQKGRDESN